jgi:hypothetical protein
LQTQANQLSEFLIKGLNQSQPNNGVSDIKTSKSPFSYLREGLLPHILNALLQSNHLHHQHVDHLMVFLSIGLKEFNLLLLPLYLPYKIIDHVGQLVDLDILGIDMTAQLIDKPPQLVGSLSHEIDMFIKTVQGMVLKMSNLLHGRLKLVDPSQ